MPDLTNHLPSVLIVGCGPGGLAARYALTEAGIPTISLDAGTKVLSQRDDRLAGVGGAGLYSDGKFSFRPSATALWQLEPAEMLHDAERMFLNLFYAHGGNIPTEVPDASEVGVDCSVKPYPSTYLPFVDRRDMINTLLVASDDPVVADATVTAIDLEADGVTLSFLSGDTMAGSSVVMATGRLGHISPTLKPIVSDTLFRRVEIGLRLQTPAAEFPLRDTPLLDPKLSGRLRDGVSWRTFCTCRNGHVLQLPWRSVRLASGRGDCPPSGYSNVGILVRVSDKGAARRLRADGLPARLLTSDLHFQASFADRSEATRQLTAAFGQSMAELLDEALSQFMKATDAQASEDWSIIGPCLEGVGQYPAIAPDLRLNVDRRVICAGDCTGIFRGLTAALVSGFYVGLQLKKALNV